MASDFDPRFDPAFQRGFEARRSVASPVADRFSEEQLQRPSVDPPARLVQPTLDRDDVDAPGDQGLAVGAAPFETRGNPWLRALWIVAGVFIAGGVAAQFAAQSSLQVTTPTALEFYVIPATTAALSPWFVVTGLLAGVVALVLNAIRWRPEFQ